MSSVKLKKDHDDKKKGDVISVPFGVGKQLVADGVAEYPEQPAAEVAAKANAKADADAAEKVKLLERELSAAQKKIADLESERAELKKAAGDEDAKKQSAGTNPPAGKK